MSSYSTSSFFASAFFALLILVSGGMVTSTAQASIDVYEFDDPEKESQFRTLASELRCPKCQNQNVNDSNAPLARDIKDRVYQLIEEGKSDKEIVDYMVERYGEFVTYRPRMSLGVALLWGAPAALGLFVLVFLLLSRRASPKLPAAPIDQQRIQSMLDKYSDVLASNSSASDQSVSDQFKSNPSKSNPSKSDPSQR
jgi:cytochrome c-type biogenesis protein CcmH